MLLILILKYKKWTGIHIKEQIYMKQPKWFVVKGKNKLVCMLKVSMYGLKQSPRMWCQNFYTYILELGFTRSKEYHYVHFKLVGVHLICLVLYVNDMWLIRKNKEITHYVKIQLFFCSILVLKMSFLACKLEEIEQTWNSSLVRGSILRQCCIEVYNVGM